MFISVTQPRNESFHFFHSFGRDVFLLCLVLLLLSLNGRLLCVVVFALGFEVGMLCCVFFCVCCFVRMTFDRESVSSWSFLSCGMEMNEHFSTHSAA